MSIFVIGGTGFIGSRLVRALAARGERVVCMDVDPRRAAFDDLGERVTVVAGDVTHFDDLMARMAAAEPERVVNLSYLLGSFHPPRTAFKLNVLGMDNCFEAARLCGVRRVVYASSLAVYGLQAHYGERAVTEDDPCHGRDQYAMHKIFNEWQAEDYREKHGMSITGIRPANVTGPDKVRGSVDHVNCITWPARGEAISFPYADLMRLPVHVDDVTDAFERVVMADAPEHPVYNSGGVPISMGELAAIVRELLPGADIQFRHRSGGREKSGLYLMDNTRLTREFGVQFRPFRERVVQIINEARREAGLAEIDRA